MSPQSFVLIIVMNLSLMLGKNLLHMLIWFMALMTIRIIFLNTTYLNLEQFYLIKPFFHKAPKSIFLKEFSENFILDLVTKTLLDPNICVERQDYWTVLIRRWYAIMLNYIRNYKTNSLVLLVIYRNKIFDELKNKSL